MPKHPPIGVWLFGPYHRVQAPATNTLMTESRTIAGEPRRNFYASDIPRVKANCGVLPEGQEGIEFYTCIPPDSANAPGSASWSEARPGVSILRVPGPFRPPLVAIPVWVIREISR